MKNFTKIYLLSALLFLSASLQALDLMNVWRHSEIADKNSVFCDIGTAFYFENFEFKFLPVEIRLDYMPPLPLPFSLGVFMYTPYPNLKSFGTRAGYHFDLLDDVTDFYVVYVFDFGFLRNDTLVKYKDTPVDKHLYDFRAGVRRFFSQRIGLVVESGFHFESVIIMLSIKIN